MSKGFKTSVEVIARFNWRPHKEKKLLLPAVPAVGDIMKIEEDNYEVAHRIFDTDEDTVTVLLIRAR